MLDVDAELIMLLVTVMSIFSYAVVDLQLLARLFCRRGHRGVRIAAACCRVLEESGAKNREEEQEDDGDDDDDELISFLWATSFVSNEARYVKPEACRLVSLGKPAWKLPRGDLVTNTS